MTFEDKVAELASKCRQAIGPLIDRDYVLFGLPYYNNIGDVLIWEGERDLLKSSEHKCVGVCGWASYPKEPLKDKNTLILITGGGYMGDLWRKAWQSVIDCIQRNPENKIVILPNTLHYDDKALIEQDRKVMERCRDLTLCMRDSRSLALAKEYFPNTRSILVPDMAFCINPRTIKRLTRRPTRNTLLLKRLDKEISSTPIPASILAQHPDIHDWPTMEKLMQTGKPIFEERLFNFIVDKIIKITRRTAITTKIINWLYKVWFRPMMIRVGVRFVSSYREIFTTRLHVMILSVLIGRNCWLIDNSYGKLSSFYDTWLTDCDCVNYFKE